MNFSVLGIFFYAAVGENTNAEIMADGVDDGCAAAAFPFGDKRDMVGCHDVFKNRPCSAAPFPQDKIFIRKIIKLYRRFLSQRMFRTAYDLLTYFKNGFGLDFLAGDDSLHQSKIQFVMQHAMLQNLCVVDVNRNVNIRAAFF